MQGLDDLAIRLRYNGGSQSKNRMDRNKQMALKDAYKNSYQSAIVKNKDGIEFRCLINSDKLTMNYDNKILSILYEDIPVDCSIPHQTLCTNINVGDVVTWVNNKTRWLVYLQSLGETAYFKAQIRRCKYFIQIGKARYWFYLSGPTETIIEWERGHNNYINSLNYHSSIYITKNKETEDFFHRFTKIKIDNKPYEVQAVDSISTDGILKISIKEDYSNTPAEWAEANKEEEVQIESYIKGDRKVKPYDIKEYTIDIADNQGYWLINSKLAKIIESDNIAVKIEILTGKSGSFDLIYRSNGEDLILPITIESL